MPPIEPVDVATSELCAVNVNVSRVFDPYTNFFVAVPGSPYPHKCIQFLVDYAKTTLDEDYFEAFTEATYDNKDCVRFLP